MKIMKITEGYVTQIFEDGECVTQQFTADDNVEYFNDQDKTLDPNFVRDHVGIVYQPFDMVQPQLELDYYILKLIGLVEPELIGPLTKKECAEQLSAFRDDSGEVENSHTGITVTKGAEIDT